AAHQVFGQVRFSRQYRADRLKLRSYGQANFARTRLNDYSSTGTGVHSCGTQTADSLELTFGMRGETSSNTRAGRLSPHAVLELSRNITRVGGVAVTGADGTALTEPETTS